MVKLEDRAKESWKHSVAHTVTGTAHVSIACWNNLKPGGAMISSPEGKFSWCEVNSVPIPPGHTIYSNLMKDILTVVLDMTISAQKKKVQVPAEAMSCF